MNVLMISIGDTILSNPMGDTLVRQQEYADKLGHIDMIVFSPKKNHLNTKHYENLSIYPTKSMNMLTFIFDVLAITNEIFKVKKIDVITTQDPFGTALVGYILKKKYNIPLHIQNHSCFLNNRLWITEKPILFSIFNQIAHFTLRHADRLRVVNTTEKEKYIHELGIPEAIIDIAPVPVNTEFWQSPPSEEEKLNFIQKYKIDITKPILAWAGRPVKVKNLPYLFSSIAKVQKKNDVNFLIAGNMKNSYWDMVDLKNKFQLQPIYLGILSHQELKIMYYLTDIYLHTSNYEGFGLVVSDAQACGTVVVSRKTAGTQEIIEDGKSGYLISSDEKAFATQILDILQDKNHKARLSKYAKNMMSKKFQYHDMFLTIINSIKKTIIP